MDDLIKSFKAQLYDRVSSPLLSSFLISWAIWNHRLFAVLITSDMKIKEKFAYADNVLYPTVREVGFRGFLWPLSSALILLFVYPIPGRWVYEYVRKEQKRLKEIQQKIDDETPLTREEARELRIQVRQAATEFERVIAERETQIKDLQRELEGLRANLAFKETADGSRGQTRNEIDVQRVQLTNLEAQVLTSIATSTNFKLEDKIFSEIDEPHVRIKHALDQLEAYQFITPGETDFGKRYALTTQGRAFYVKVLDFDEKKA
jgi:hypothetical protein